MNLKSVIQRILVVVFIRSLLTYYNTIIIPATAPCSLLPASTRDKLEALVTPDQAAFHSSYGEAMVTAYREEGRRRFGDQVYRWKTGQLLAC